MQQWEGHGEEASTCVLYCARSAEAVQLVQQVLCQFFPEKMADVINMHLFTGAHSALLALAVSLEFTQSVSGVHVATMYV